MTWQETGDEFLATNQNTSAAETATGGTGDEFLAQPAGGTGDEFLAQPAGGTGDEFLAGGGSTGDEFLAGGSAGDEFLVSGGDPVAETAEAAGGFDWYNVWAWFETTWIGEGIRNSLWQFPVIEAIHLVAFAVMGGAILIVDLRLTGLVLRNQTAQELADTMRKWFIGALLMMILTGVALFMSESVKLYYSDVFHIKMIGLISAILWGATLRKKVIAGRYSDASPMLPKVVGVISILLWATVAWGGRWIGFSG